MDNLWRKYITHISASQIKTHRRSARRWAIEKLLKLPGKTSEAMEFGSRIHKIIEDMYEGRYHSDLSDLEDSIISDFMDHSYPDPAVIGPQHEVEKKIKYYLGPGLPPVVGFIDLYIEGTIPTIVDHKTSRTRRYFLSARDLKTDIQMILYAAWALSKNLGAKGVKVVHNQIAYSLIRQKTKVVTTHICRERVDLELAKIRKEVRDGIIQTIKRFDSGRLGAVSPVGCTTCSCAFGPNSCEYSAVCSGRATPAQFLAMSENNREALKKDLTNQEKSDIIKVSSEGSMIVYLPDIVKKHRDNSAHLNSVWDRREYITAHTIKEIEDMGKIDFVLLPLHFAGGLDPDYQPIISQLKERGQACAIQY